MQSVLLTVVLQWLIFWNCVLELGGSRCLSWASWWPTSCIQRVRCTWLKLRSRNPNSALFTSSQFKYIGSLYRRTLILLIIHRIMSNLILVEIINFIFSTLRSTYTELICHGFVLLTLCTQDLILDFCVVTGYTAVCILIATLMGILALCVY